MKKTMKMILGVLVAILVGACSEVPKEATTKGAISGAVVLGDNYNGSVVLYDLFPDGGIIPTKSQKVATSDGGQFSFDLPAYANGPILLVASGGTYVDLARAEAMRVSEAPESGFSYLIGEYRAGSKIADLAITPISSLHASVSRKLVEKRGWTLKNASEFARSRFQYLFVGIDMLVLPYQNITKADAGSPSTESALRGLFLGGFSTMAQEISDKAPKGSIVDIAVLAKTLFRDYESDGVFDGRAKTGTANDLLSIPVDVGAGGARTELSPMTLRYDLARTTQSFIRGSRNVAGIKEDDYRQIKQIAWIVDDTLFGDTTDAGNPYPAPPQGEIVESDYFKDTNIAPRKNPDGTLKYPSEFDYPVTIQDVGKVHNEAVVERFTSLLNEIATPDRRVYMRMKYSYSGPPLSEVAVSLTAVNPGGPGGQYVSYSGTVDELKKGVARLVLPTKSDGGVDAGNDAGFVGDGGAGDGGAGDGGTGVVYEYQLPKGAPYGLLKFTWTAKSADGQSSTTDYIINLVAPRPPLVVREDLDYYMKTDTKSIWGSASGIMSGYKLGSRIIHYEVYNPLEEKVYFRVADFGTATASDGGAAPVITLAETWKISNDYDAGAAVSALPGCLSKQFYHPYFIQLPIEWVNNYRADEYNGLVCDDMPGAKKIDFVDDQSLGEEWGECYSTVISKLDGVGMKRNKCHTLPNWSPCGPGHSKRPMLPADQYVSCRSNSEVKCIDTYPASDPFGFNGSGMSVLFNTPAGRKPSGKEYYATASLLKDFKEISASTIKDTNFKQFWIIPPSSEEARLDVYFSALASRASLSMKSLEGVPAPMADDGNTNNALIGYTYDTHGCLQYADITPTDSRCTSTGAFATALPYLHFKFNFGFGGYTCTKDQPRTTSSWLGYNVYGKLTGFTLTVDVSGLFQSTADPSLSSTSDVWTPAANRPLRVGQ